MLKKLLISIAIGVATAPSLAQDHSAAVNGKHIEKIEVDESEALDLRDYDKHMRDRGYDYESHHRANRKLRARIIRLERAVRQLQDTVFLLEQSQHTAPAKQHTCMLKTYGYSSKTFIGIGKTKVEAQAKAWQQCEIKSKYCKGELQCDEN